jgi:hypothetical protein
VAEPGKPVAGNRALSLALAQQAYASRAVRLVSRDLTGCDHLAATRRGLFAVGLDGPRLIAHGQFFGITIEGDDIFAFEACARPRDPSRLGRIVRLRRDQGRIIGAAVVAQGLDNGCHQIDLIGDTLIVVDTYRQRLVAIGRDGGRAEHQPIPGADTWSTGYVHMNAVIASGDHRLVVLHNGGDHTAQCSEVAVLDADWCLLERRPLAGSGCHNLAVLEDGTLLSCGSLAGELVGSDGLRVKVTDLMTRGLSVGVDVIAVGGSPFAERDLRDGLGGEVRFLDRNYQSLAIVPMPAPPMEIRRLDGADLSLSNHVRSRGLAVRWPA